jgi:hypothetical protein
VSYVSCRTSAGEAEALGCSAALLSADDDVVGNDAEAELVRVRQSNNEPPQVDGLRVDGRLPARLALDGKKLDGALHDHRNRLHAVFGRDDPELRVVRPLLVVVHTDQEGGGGSAFAASDPIRPDQKVD